MTIYVDSALIRARVGRLDSYWCHLMSDQLDPTELHAFAARVGLRRAWFQRGKSAAGRELYPPRDHYDVTEGRRRQAVAAGAVEINGGGVVSLINQRRAAWCDAQARRAEEAM